MTVNTLPAEGFLQTQNLVKRFGDFSAVNDVSLSIKKGEIFALLGSSGCGKSTLLRLLVGRMEKESGTIMQGQQVRLGYFSQHQLETLMSSGTVLGEIRRLSDPRTTEEELMSVLGLFMLGQEYFDRQVSGLSGGEKSRLVLASLFLKRCNFLLLDEPTNHLDLESREALVAALKKFTGTLLMVAHDRWLLSQVGAEAWELDKNGLTVFPDFAAYDAERRARMAGTGQTAPATSGGTANAQGAANALAQEILAQNLSREEQKRLKREQGEKRNALHKEIKPLQGKYDALEKELTRVLEKQGTVEAQLADPEVYADHEKAAELLKSFEVCKKRGEDLFEEMTALEERMETVRARWNPDI